MFPQQSYSKDVAQSISYSPTKTRETTYFSEELSPHLPPLYHIQT